MLPLLPTRVGKANQLVALMWLAGACGDPSIGSKPDASSTDAAAAADATVPAGPKLCASEAGTRLTRAFIEPSAGKSQELQIIDTELGEDCSYSIEADGTFTCYPTDFGGQIFFQDAACTSAIVGVGVGATPRTFARARRLSDGGCFLAKHFRRIGMPSAVVGGQSVFRQDNSGTCSPATAPIRDYYLAGPELPISSFVTASRGAASENGRLASATFEGSDGSSMCDFAGAIFDATLGNECQPTLGVDSETYCMPVAGSATNVFTNAGCTEETSVAVVDRCADEPPAYARSTESLTCGEVATTIRSVTNDALAQRFENVNNVCVADSGTDRFFPVGDVVESAEFAPLSTELESGAGRLTRKLIVDGAGFQSFGDLWHDQTLDVDCRFSDAVDGSLRCLPLTRSTQSFFSDANCLISIELSEVDGCQDDRVHFGFRGALGTRILSAEPHTEPVFSRVGAVCEPASGSFLVPAFELAPSSFVQADIVEF